jgi:hypothetical protein
LDQRSTRNNWHCLFSTYQIHGSSRALVRLLCTISSAPPRGVVGYLS